SLWRSAGAFPVNAAGWYGSGWGMTEFRALSTSSPQTRSYGTGPTHPAISTPRYRRTPPSLSGSAISVSTATTPSSPGLKSSGTAGIYPAGRGGPAGRVGPRGAPRDSDSGRRHGPRADRGAPPRPRGDRRRVRLGRAAGRHRRDGAKRR